MKDIENDLFKLFKKYIQDKSKFNPEVLPDRSKHLVNFPTITMYESSNVTNIEYTTLDRKETVNDLRYVIDIYSKDKVIGNTKYASKNIIKELRELTFNFFDTHGFIRTEATKTDYINYEVDRYMIIYTAKINSWNLKINN